MNLSCTTDKYDTLYARWLRDPGKLLDFAGWKPGMTLLDLCGGTGVVSKEAIRRGASPEDITLVDINPRAKGTGVRQIACRAEDAWRHDALRGHRFDVVVCRQAVAYLPLESDPVDLFLGLRWLLRPDGVLVFNTFVKPRWSAKAYAFGGHRYVEVSVSIGSRVWHLQWCVKEGADWTRFQWHTKDAIMDALTRYFQDEVDVVEDGRSLYFRARGGLVSHSG